MQAGVFPLQRSVLTVSCKGNIPAVLILNPSAFITLEKRVEEHTPVVLILNPSSLY